MGKQVVEHLSVEYVHGLAAFQLKELVDLFGAATGATPHFAYFGAKSMSASRGLTAKLFMYVLDRC